MSNYLCFVRRLVKANFILGHLRNFGTNFGTEEQTKLETFLQSTMLREFFLIQDSIIVRKKNNKIFRKGG